jgi:very-short-patch-repair endonuclease
VPEAVGTWWARRQWSKGTDDPYPIGTYRAAWARYPALIRQYHPDLNSMITLTQIPPAADVYLVWQCEVGHLFVATPEEQRMRPGRERRRSVWCPSCSEEAAPRRIREPGPPPPRAPRPRKTPLAPPHTVGDAFWSAHAPRPASAAEALLRQRLGERFEFDLSLNAVRVGRPFFTRLEVWPDFVLSELRVAIEYDTVGRHGLEHVGRREEIDRRKDRLLREAGWEVIRVRMGKLLELGPYDIVGVGPSKLVAAIEERLGDIRGPLFVSAYARIPGEPSTLSTTTSMTTRFGFS